MSLDQVHGNDERMPILQEHVCNETHSTATCSRSDGKQHIQKRSRTFQHAATSSRIVRMSALQIHSERTRRIPTTHHQTFSKTIRTYTTLRQNAFGASPRIYCARSPPKARGNARPGAAAAESKDSAESRRSKTRTRRKTACKDAGTKNVRGKRR